MQVHQNKLLHTAYPVDYRVYDCRFSFVKIFSIYGILVYVPILLPPMTQDCWHFLLHLMFSYVRDNMNKKRLVFFVSGSLSAPLELFTVETSAFWANLMLPVPLGTQLTFYPWILTYYKPQKYLPVPNLHVSLLRYLSSITRSNTKSSNVSQLHLLCSQQNLILTFIGWVFKCHGFRESWKFQRSFTLLFVLCMMLLSA